ncbi:MAG: lipopolysaccharide biosynthesis protein [Tepidisphaeraceae bacterium]
MSTASTQIPVSIGPPDEIAPAWRALPARTWATLNSSRSAWVLCDQFVVSLGNFLTVNLLARFLSIEHYGAFVLLLETIFFLNGLQAALVIFPMTVRGAAGESGMVGRLASAGTVFTMILAPVLFVGMIIAGAQVGSVAFGLWGCLAVVLWQMQETTRRALMADLRFRDVVVGDAISYIGQAALVALLIATHTLSVPTALLSMAITRGLAAFVQSLQVGIRRVCRVELLATAKDFWSLGGWSLLSALAVFVSANAYTWTLQFAWGLSVVAVWGAIVSMMKLVNPLMSSIGSLIVPAAARARTRSGPHEAWRITWRYSMAGFIALIPVFAILALAPHFCLRVLYGSNSPYLSADTELRVFTLNYILLYWNTIFQAVLGALEKVRGLLAAQLINAGATLLVGLPLTVKFGVIGLIIGGLFATVAMTVVHLYLLYATLYRTDTAAPRREL